MKMKVVALILALFSTGLLFAEGKESQPEYYEVSDTEISAMSAKEAEFRFQVTDMGFETKKMKISVNGVWRTVTADKENAFTVRVTPGAYRFQFFISQEFGEITTGDLDIAAKHRKVIQLNFQSARIYNLEEKPIIYCYSPTDTPLEITVKPEGEMTFTYPQSDGKWLGVVKASGGIEVDGATYPYLFWEAKTEGLSKKVDWNDSELISAGEALAYLERVSDQIGFNEKEKTDFITYWGPRLAQIPMSEVKIIQEDATSVFGKLSVSDQSFTVARAYIVFRPAPTMKRTETNIQTLKKLNRTEKFVLEWGGAELPEKTTDNF